MTYQSQAARDAQSLSQSYADYIESHALTPTGVHTHPLTHPAWMEFADNNCVVCASYPKMTNHDEYQRSIAVSDRAWYHLQSMIQEHGMAADITTVAREAYLHTVTAKNDAYEQAHKSLDEAWHHQERQA
jgi:hypothetical protein